MSAEETKKFEAPAGNPEYDLDKHRDDTTMKAVAGIYKILGQYAEQISFKHDAEGKDIANVIDEVTDKVMDVVIDCNVPNKDMQKLIENMFTLIQLIMDGVSKRKNGFETELLARVIGTRNPKDGVYSREYASLGDLFAALLKVRDEQGNNPLDYFYQNTAPELSPEEMAALEAQAEFDKKKIAEESAATVAADQSEAAPSEEKSE